MKKHSLVLLASLAAGLAQAQVANVVPLTARGPTDLDVNVETRYLFEVKNTGTAVANGVTAMVAIPDGATIVLWPFGQNQICSLKPATAAPQHFTTRFMLCSLGNFSAGVKVALTVGLKAPGLPANHVFKVVVSSSSEAAAQTVDNVSTALSTDFHLPAPDPLINPVRQINIQTCPGNPSWARCASTNSPAQGTIYLAQGGAVFASLLPGATQGGTWTQPTPEQLNLYMNYNNGASQANYFLTSDSNDCFVGCGYFPLNPANAAAMRACLQ